MSEEKKIIPVRIYGDEVLNQHAEPLTDLSDEDLQLIEEMANTMYENNGIGLAANQVGILKKIVVIDVDQISVEGGGKGKPNLRVFINPTITEVSEDDTPYQEGCLSLPGIDAQVYRPALVSLTYCDTKMHEHSIECDDLLARVVQHEVDHLAGVLFVDHLGFMKRRLLAGQLNRLKKQALEESKKC